MPDLASLERTSAQIKAEIEAFFGFSPPFFEPAWDSPAVLEHLWQQTIAAYINNPLPAVFKEKLFAYLSRYCAVPYCVVCHSCALSPLGLTAKQILDVLTEPTKGVAAALDRPFITWAGQAEPLAQFPEEPELVQEIYEAAIAIFLYPSQTESIHQALRRLLSNTDYTYLTLFLAYIRLCHQWIESYPELAYSADQRVQKHLADLLQAEPALADFFANYTERVKAEQKRREDQLADELAKREQREIALRESEERLRLILQNMPVMLCAFDDQHKMMIWNHECERVTGYSAAAMIGNPQAMAWLYPDATYRQHMIDAWTERGNDYRDWEWEMTCSDGSVKTVAWSNISDRFPIPGWRNWGIGVDVTNRKQTEANLRARNQELLTFHRLAEITLNTQSLKAAFQNIVKEISAATAFPIIAIELYDAARQVMVFEGTEGIPLPPDGQPIEVPVAQTSSGTVVQTGQMLVKTYDPQESKKCDSNESLRQLGIKTFICVPMTVNQTTIGVLSLAHTEVVPTEADFLQWLTSLANYLALVTDRQRTEIAHRENAAFLKLALDFTHIGSWDWCVSTNEVIWNENHARLLGLVPGEVQASYQSWRDRVHPDDLDRVEQAVKQALEAKTNFEAEYRVIHPDGSVHWLIGKGRGLYDASGQVIRMIGVVLDVTDRKQSENALRESEAQFRSLSACSPVGIYLASPEGYGTYTNPRCREIFGFTLDESMDSGWAERLHPDDREWLFQAWSAAATNGQPFTADYRVKPREDIVRWVQTRTAPMLSDHGVLIGHVGTIEDITDYKQAEAQIRQLNQTLEQHNLELEALVEQRTAELMTFINMLPDYIFVVERDTMRILFCNDQNARLSGCESRHQMAGKTLFECFPPDLAATFAEQNQQVFASGATLHFQECYTTLLGTLHFDTYKIPLKKPNGEVYALIGSSRDITELVAARQKLADRTTQLEIVNQELESFSYSVSHDLRAPLRHIRGFVAALSERLDKNGHLSDPKVIHYLQILQNSSQTMGQLIDGLLTLSRMGRRQMAQNPVDLHQLVATVLSQLPDDIAPDATLETAGNEQPVRFSVGDLPTVMGDATLLQQVFANLIDNAIKFSRVRETSAKQNRHPAHIEISSLADGTIFVRDHGVGFQMAYADQLFGAFQRLHSQSEFEGTGIGLAIVQRIIHRHGGDIWAESQPGQGATFYFKLGDRPLPVQPCG